MLLGFSVRIRSSFRNTRDGWGNMEHLLRSVFVTLRLVTHYADLGFNETSCFRDHEYLKNVNGSDKSPLLH